MTEPLSAVPPADVDVLDTTDAGPIAIRGGMLRTAGFVGGLLLTLASAPLVVRHLGDVDFGRYSTVLAVIAIVTGLTEGGINTIALRELSVEVRDARQDRMMGDLLGLRIVLSSCGLVVAVGFSAIAGYGGDLVLGTMLAGIGMVAMLTQSMIAMVLQSRLRFGLATLVELARQIFFTAMVIIIVQAGGGVVALLAVAVPTGIGALVLTAMLVRGLTTLRPTFHPRRWARLLRETIVFAAAIAINSLYFRVTLVIMSLVASAEQTGRFAISYRVMEVLIVVPALLVSAAFPIIARSVESDVARFESGAKRLFELAIIVGAFLSLSVYLVAPFAIEVLAGDRHDPAVGVLQLQSIALTASFVAVATGYPLLGLRRYRETLIANCSSLVMAIVLTLLLAPAHGAHGAAVSAVVADATLAIANTVFLCRRGGPKVSLRVVPVVLVAAAAGLTAGTVVAVHPLVQVVVGCAAYVAVLAALRSFPHEVGELLRSRRRVPPQR